MRDMDTGLGILPISICTHIHHTQIHFLSPRKREAVMPLKSEAQQDGPGEAEEDVADRSQLTRRFWR